VRIRTSYGELNILSPKRTEPNDSGCFEDRLLARRSGTLDYSSHLSKFSSSTSGNNTRCLQFIRDFFAYNRINKLMAILQRELTNLESLDPESIGVNALTKSSTSSPSL
jgi:hypothetical protein